MPYRFDPGSCGAVLLVCFVLFPALFLVVRRKWRLAEARRLEVLRLVRLATAEAEWAEREAAAFSSAAEPLTTPLDGKGMGMSICAVCKRTTSNRCARCKVVKYCSGKCQIIHWRQGHKDECHPAPVDRPKSQPLSHLKGGQTERSEITDNGPEIKFHSYRNNDRYSTYQNASTMEGEQAEEVFFSNIRLVSDGHIDSIAPLETSSIESVQSKPDHPLEVYNEVGTIRQKPFERASGEAGYTVSTSCLPAATEPAVPCPGEMTDDASSNEGHSHSKTGQHSNTNPPCVSFGHTGKPFFGGSLKSSRTPFVDLEQVKLPTISAEVATAYCFGNVSSNNFMPTHVNEEAECKSNAPSSIKSYSSNRYLDARLCQKDIESRASDSTSEISNRSEVSKFYKCDNAVKDTTVRIVKSNDLSESQTSCNSDHSRVDAKPLSAGTIKLSTPKCFCPVSIPVKLEPSNTKSTGFGKSYAVKSNEQNPLSLSVGNHSSPLVKSSTSPRNVSLIVENDPPLLNGQALLIGDIKPGVSIYGSVKYDYKMLFPYELFIKLYNSDKVGLNPCGLINCGNSCYANVVLQCLAFTRPLAAYLLEGLHAKTCPKKEWCFTCAFGSLLVKANQGKSPLSPIGIISHIHDIGGNFSHGTEEDAHEFLRHAIDAMQSACLKEIGAAAVGELAQETTLIQLMFGGYLHSKIKCLRCKSKSEHRERMMDLTVEMHYDIETLEEALGRFTAAEVLEGENKYKCDRCKSYEHAKKHLTILEAPNVLTIALKRYQYGKYGKLNKMVRFPEYLNLAPYMRESDDKSPVYRLYAVVVHSDVMNATFSGHYVCFVKNTTGKWFKADDTMVKQVDLQTVLSQGAYMLLYSRCSPRAPSLVRKEIAKRSRLKQIADSHNPKRGSNPIFSQLRSSNSGPRDLFNARTNHSKLDISSDSSSLFSYSDETSSWSAESTKDSATSEDFTESVYSE